MILRIILGIGYNPVVLVKMYAKGSDYFCSVRWFMHALSYSTIHIISSHVYEELVMCMSHVYEELVMCMSHVYESCVWGISHVYEELVMCMRN